MTEHSASFTRGLFTGAIHDSLLFPYPETLDRRDPDEARVVTRLLRQLREAEHDGLIDSQRFDEEETLPEEVIRYFAEIGMLGLTIPQEFGGLGLSATAYARVFAGVSSIDASLGVLIGVHCGLGSKAIVLHGTAEQKARYLPMLARGETLAAYGLTEPETGSDAQHIKTRATLDAATGEWVLNGRKIWIGNGQRAGVIATFAQTTVERRGESVERPTAFIIRPDMAGFVVEDTERKMGIRGSTQARLRYDDLRVPADHVLGTVGKGFAVAVTVLNGGRLTLAAGCAGASKDLLTEMARYAEARVQFGAPLASFEITQRKMAGIAADAYAGDAMVGSLAAMAEDPESDSSLEAAAAKVFCSELIWRATDEMVQVAGGRGYVQGGRSWARKLPYERIMRDSRINRIFEGANEVLKLFIALNGIQGPAAKLKELASAFRAPLRNLGLVSGYAATRVKSALGATATLDAELHPRLKEHKEYFEKHVGELSQAAERAVMKHRKAIVERQLVLERLADMAIELYATAAVLARTQKLLAERGEAACARELALCDLFCVESGRRFRTSRVALDGREEEVDDRRREVAAAVRAAAGYFVSDAILDAPGAPDDRPRRHGTWRDHDVATVPETAGTEAGELGGN